MKVNYPPVYFTCLAFGQYGYFWIDWEMEINSTNCGNQSSLQYLQWPSVHFKSWSLISQLGRGRILLWLWFKLLKVGITVFLQRAQKHPFVSNDILCHWLKPTIIRICLRLQKDLAHRLPVVWNQQFSFTRPPHNDLHWSTWPGLIAIYLCLFKCFLCEIWQSIMFCIHVQLFTHECLNNDLFQTLIKVLMSGLSELNQL